MSAESDELLFMIRRYVAGRVAPQHQAEVVEGIVRTLTVMMADPRFYGQLTCVAQLQMENEMLRQQLANLTAVVARYQPVKVTPRKSTPRKRTPSKKASARNPVATKPKVTVKGSTAANRRAFKQGYVGR